MKFIYIYRNFISEKFPETCDAQEAQAADLNRVDMDYEVFLAGLARVRILLDLVFSARREVFFITAREL